VDNAAYAVEVWYSSGMAKQETVSVRIYKSTRQKAKQLAAKQGITISQVIAAALK